jgi:hypothetical protein
MALHKGTLSAMGIREAKNAIEPILLVLVDERF